MLKQTAPGSSNLEILTALRDGLAPARLSHRPAGPVPATPDALGPVMAELRVLRAELAELRALIVTGQVVQPGKTGPIQVQPTGQPPEPELLPELPSEDAEQLRPAAVQAEPMLNQPEAPVPASLPPEPELRANHAELLERLHAGGQLVRRGQQLTELNINGSTRGMVDRRTINSLVHSKWLLERDRDLHLTSAAVVLLGARARR